MDLDLCLDELFQPSIEVELELLFQRGEPIRRIRQNDDHRKVPCEGQLQDLRAVGAGVIEFPPGPHEATSDVPGGCRKVPVPRFPRVETMLPKPLEIQCT